MKGKLDPITLEIIRHRVEEILAEMYYAVVRTSGNPILCEAGDHEEAVCDSTGDIIVAGGGVVEWTTCLGSGAKYLIEHFGKDPGFHEGEQWIHNYAYGAAVHAMDIQVLKPIFYKGELVAWAVSAGHQTDIGGATPGGFNFYGGDFFSEGLQIRGLRFVENGKVRTDVEETLRGMMRVPDDTMMGIYAAAASNNTAESRIISCYDRYGPDVMKAFYKQIKDYSEARVKARLRQIPDGSWYVEQFCESIIPDEPYIKVAITLTKKNDELILDFTGSSPQSKGSQNVGPLGAMSNAHCSFLSLMCFDIPWNSGAWRCVRFVLPEGTVVNPAFPAATSANTPAGAGYMIINTTHDAISRMLLSSGIEELRKEAFAASCAGVLSPTLYGEGHQGEYKTIMIMDNIIGGMGASEFHDGDDTWGNEWGPKTQLANIETCEARYPLLYVTRADLKDTGGPGKFRGGNGLVIAYTPYDSPTLHLHHHAVGIGMEPRRGAGLAGGYPAVNLYQGVIRGSHYLDRLKQGVIQHHPLSEGKVEILPVLRASELKKNDIYFETVSGGGGYGDPIERDIRSVERDVQEGCLSIEKAKECYGVTIDPETFKADETGTKKLRRLIVEQRLKT